MKKILIIGIGAGNPEHVTIQAVNALNQVDVFFIMNKGIAKGKLVDLRKEICSRYIAGHNYRFVEAASPERNRDNPHYECNIEELNKDKQQIFERLIAEELADGECGGFLVWGDPTLYDSTIRIIAAIVRSGRQRLEFDVIPGISSIQVLAASHKVALNRIGQPIEITTGRKLAEALPGNFTGTFSNDVDSVVVMLDAENTYKKLLDRDLDIYWGAYIGTPDEVLIAGKLSEVADEIERVRNEARETNGWIMDTYLLRKSDAT
ncbi:MAG TPA: precorrin-6A synthase (deacetylating) [Spongiibacteraceae bacterium]|nr:precorrin-6A synthase (deacetylating) [Spongiibacteraceae bacterium]